MVERKWLFAHLDDVMTFRSGNACIHCGARAGDRGEELKVLERDTAKLESDVPVSAHALRRSVKLLQEGMRRGRWNRASSGGRLRRAGRIILVCELR